MKSILITALLGYLIAPCHAQVAPMTGTTPDALISAVVAKYCDVYSMQPKADSIFVFGSSARDELHRLGVEEIIITCLDGHQKTFWMGKELKRKMAQIDYVSSTEGIIEWSDKTKSRSKTYYSTVRPVTYVVISKG